MALRAAILRHVRVPVKTLTLTLTLTLTGRKSQPWGSYGASLRFLSSHGDDHLSKDEVIERVLSVIKSFPKVDPSQTQAIDTTIHRSNVGLLCRFAIYFNGVIHWLGFFDNGRINELGQNCDREIILSFDMSHEVFQKLKYPVDSVSSMRRNKVFSVFNDCLAFVVYEEYTMTMTEKYFDIWVMREYGVEDSWTKQLVVGPLLGIGRPLHFSKNGVLLVGDDGTVVLYKLVLKKL